MKKNAVGIAFLTLLLLTLSTCSPLTGVNSGELKAISGSDQIVMSVTPVTLDGSASTGDTISYSWTQTAGTSVTLSSSTAAKPTFTSPGLTPGTTEDLIFSLTVDDGTDISTVSVTITVLTWKQVDTGLEHTIALRSDGTIWAWGQNWDGQIGQGNTSNSYQDVITRIGADSDWAEVSAGDYHNLALKSNGTIYAWGKNRYGQIGNNTSGTGAADVTIPTQVGSSSNWVTINAGEDQSYAIDLIGDVYGWGRHNLDRLGLGGSAAAEITAPTKIRAGGIVSGGGISTLAVDGATLWCWGNNAYGQLAVPDTTFGSTNVPDNTNGLTDVVDVAGGGQHSYILRNNVHGSGNDTLWSVGYNLNGELGTGGAADDPPGEITASGVTSWKALASGKNHGLAIGGNGTLWSWGYNNHGQLGLGNSGAGTERTAPEQVGTDTDWYDVVAWFAHSAGLKDDGTLWTWGASNWGAIGDSGATTDGNNSVNTPWRVGY